MTRIARWLVTAAVACFGASLAFAQTYPSKAIRLVVGFPPGAQSDNAARLLAPRLAEQLGQPVVIENRPGAGGTIAAEAVVRSPADGYTLLLGSPSNITLAPLLYPDLRYNPHADLSAVIRFARVPLVIAANPQLPIADLRDLVRYAREHPGALTCGTGTPGGQLAVQLLLDAANVEIVQVPYKGSAAAVADVIAGRVSIALADLSAVGPQAKAGMLRLLAVTDGQRLADAPDVPTTAEQGFTDYRVYSWQAIMVPRGTPDAVLDKLRAALAAVVATDDFRAALARNGFTRSDDDPRQLAALLAAETERYRPLVKRLGMRAEP